MADYKDISQIAVSIEASGYADEIIGEIENSLKKESNIDSILSAVYQKIILKLGKPRAITLSDKAKVVFFI